MNTAETTNIHNLRNTHAEVAQPASNVHPEINKIIDRIMFSNVIDCLIVVAILIWLVKKFNLKSFITKKSDEILETIKNLEQEKKEKKNYLEQTTEKVKNVSQEVAKMVDEGEHVAESISERIIKDAEHEASELMVKTHSLIESERNRASNRVMLKVTNAAFIIAEQHIKEAIDEKLQQKYINEFIENIENLKG